MYVLESSLRLDLRGHQPPSSNPAEGPDDNKDMEELLASQADDLCPEGSDYYDQQITKELSSHMTGLFAHSGVELYEDEATQLKQLSLPHQDMFATSHSGMLLCEIQSRRVSLM